MDVEDPKFDAIHFHKVSTTENYQIGGYVIAALTVAFVYFISPFIFRYSATVQRHAIFMHLATMSRFKRNYFDPATHGMMGTRNFYIQSTETRKGPVQIGLWHVLPKSMVSSSEGKSEEYWEECLRHNDKPIFVYFHGNAGTRTIGHRVELYKVLQEQNFHVIAFDYRGFADSTPARPSETGVVADGLAVHKWLRSIQSNKSTAPIFFWGHSLGTGISSHLTSKLNMQGQSISGLILEAPFTNMRDEVKSIYVTAIYRFLPWFDWCFGSKLEENDLAFTSDKHVKNIECPILILHVINDIIVPYRLGQRLHDIASKFREQIAKPTYFKKLTGYSMHTAHILICRHPNLPEMLIDFTKSCAN